MREVASLLSLLAAHRKEQKRDGDSSLFVFDGYVVFYMEEVVENTLCPTFSPYWGGAVSDREIEIKKPENKNSEIGVRRLKLKISEVKVNIFPIETLKFPTLTFNKISLDTFLNMPSKNTCVFRLDLGIIYSGIKPKYFDTFLILFEYKTSVWHHDMPFNCKEKEFTLYE